MLTSRKSSSTPSLSEVKDTRSVASTEQASSAENLSSNVKAVSVVSYWTGDERSNDPLLQRSIYGSQYSSRSLPGAILMG